MTAVFYAPGLPTGRRARENPRFPLRFAGGRADKWEGPYLNRRFAEEKMRDPYDVHPLDVADCECCDHFRVDLSNYKGRHGRRFLRLLDTSPYPAVEM